MKIIRLNVKVLQLMYSADDDSDYIKIREFIKSLKEKELRWLICSRFSIWRSFRTKDFYKILARFIVEESSLFIKRNPDVCTTSFLFTLIECVINTTTSYYTNLEFVKQILHRGRILTKEMLPYVSFEQYQRISELGAVEHAAFITDDHTTNMYNAMRNQVSNMTTQIHELEEQLNLLSSI